MGDKGGGWALALGFTYERLISTDLILYGASLVLEFAALIALRIKQPEMVRPFRIPGGMVGVCVVFVCPTNPSRGRTGGTSGLSLSVQVPVPVRHKSFPQTSPGRDGRIQSPAPECRESKAKETKSPLGDATTNPTTNHFRKPVPKGRKNPEPGTEVPGKQTNRNRVPVRGRHNQPDHKSFPQTSPEGTEQPRARHGSAGKANQQKPSPRQGTPQPTDHKSFPQTSPEGTEEPRAPHGSAGKANQQGFLRGRP